MAKGLKKSDLKKCIRDIPDFPKEGIIFKDITTLLKDGEAFKKSINLLPRSLRMKRSTLLWEWRREVLFLEEPWRINWELVLCL